MKKRFIVFFTLMILITPIAVFADEGVCPLGPDVTKDLYGALMILKIIAPLLCIGLSVFDAIKAVAKGDPSTDLKKVAIKFLKRMMYAIILFFIPVLVDLFFQMADVWGANGTCDLMNPEGNGTSTEPATRTTTENCAALTDKEHCDRDQKCYWDSNTNTCHVMNSR